MKEKILNILKKTWEICEKRILPILFCVLLVVFGFLLGRYPVKDNSVTASAEVAIPDSNAPLLDGEILFTSVNADGGDNDQHFDLLGGVYNLYLFEGTFDTNHYKNFYIHSGTSFIDWTMTIEVYFDYGTTSTVSFSALQDTWGSRWQFQFNGTTRYNSTTWVQQYEYFQLICDPPWPYQYGKMRVWILAYYGSINYNGRNFLSNYAQAYADGYNQGTVVGENTVINRQGILSPIRNTVTSFLNLEIFPNFPLYYIILIAFGTGLLIFFQKMFLS